MAWCFADEADDLTAYALERCKSDLALVPGLWLLEVVNVLLVAERRGRIETAGSMRFLELLRGLPIDVERDSQFEEGGALLDVARRHGLSAYDATYLAVAVRRGLPLATKDVRLTRAAQEEGVELIRPGA